MSHACKKLINSVEKCVDDSLEGLVMVNPGLRLIKDHRTVIRCDYDEVVQKGQVAVLCGGGSGHEPAYAGYVGQGMLTASVSGAVFASPPPNHILAAIRTVAANNSGGCLVVVTNYTGDRLNFGQAVELARQEQIDVSMVVVGEDCAFTSSDRTAGRRGLTGTLLILKIAGALAEVGKSLEEITRITKKTTKKMGTIGLSLTPCSVPGSGPSFMLNPDEMELGLGLHGEAGVKRMKLLTAKETVKVMMDHMLNPESGTNLELQKGDHVACIVNNLGGTSVIEMNIIAKETIQYLENKGVVVERVYTGPLITSLEMAGITITLLHIDHEIKQWLDYPTTAVAWPRPLLPHSTKDRQTPAQIDLSETDAENKILKGPAGCTINKEAATKLYDILVHVTEQLIKFELKLNDLDKQSGDGDCGSTIARGAKLLRKHLGDRDKPGLPVNHPYQLCLSLANIAGDSMGGASGGVYSLFFSSAAQGLISGCEADKWCSALRYGIQAIMKYGGAQQGDRTMLDALCPACEVLESQLKLLSPVEAFRLAVQAAQKGAETTLNMKAQAGRASYVSPDLLTKPDPGAVAVSLWMEAILDKL